MASNLEFNLSTNCIFDKFIDATKMRFPDGDCVMTVQDREKNGMRIGTAALASAAMGLFILGLASSAQADKLDDVINAGKLRCAVVLDFPPIGYRDANNEPAGFDVEYCKDLAKALDVDFELLPVTWAERLPSIITNRADVVFGGTSDSLERAKTVGFSIPYAIYYAQAVVGKDSGIKTFEDMRGKRIAAAVGTVPEQEFLKYAKKWGTENLYQGYQSENEVFLAVAQGKADAGITTNTAVKPIAAKYDSIIAGSRAKPMASVKTCLGSKSNYGFV